MNVLVHAVYVHGAIIAAVHQQAYLQSCCCALVGLCWTASSQVAFEENSIGLVILHRGHIKGIKSKHNISQLLNVFSRELQLLVRRCLWSS